MQKHYQQKHCLQCRDVTFHFRQMLLGLPGMWQNIWLIVLQVLLCSLWKINTLSFHYRQAIRHSFKWSQNQIWRENCRTFACHFTSGSFITAVLSTSMTGLGIVHLEMGSTGQGWNSRKGSAMSLKKCSQVAEHSLGWDILCIHLAHLRYTSCGTP